MALIWGVNFPIIKTALPELPALAFNALRFPLASVGILGIVLLTRRMRWPERRDLPAVIALGLVANVGYQYFFIVGLERTSAGNASILLATIPAWTTILSTVVGHERVPGRVWVGVLGALAGIPLVVSGGTLSGLPGGDLHGDLLILASSVTWAFYTVGAKGLIHRYGPMPVTAWTLWVGTIGIVVMGIPALRTVRLEALSPGAWAAVAWAGVFAIAIAYALWNRGVRALGNARTAIYQNTVPVIALAVSWPWLGEVPTPMQIAGAALIIASVSWARRPVRPAVERTG